MATAGLSRCQSIVLPDTIILEKRHYENLTDFWQPAQVPFATAASAAPLSPNVSVAPESNIQNVRMVCNEAGQCWRERGERRVIIREHSDLYGIRRRERYIERRGYEERGGILHRRPRRQRRNRHRSLLKADTVRT